MSRSIISQVIVDNCGGCVLMKSPCLEGCLVAKCSCCDGHEVVCKGLR